MKRSIVALMTTIIIGSTILAGCAGNDASADSESNTADTTQEAAAGDETGTEDTGKDTSAGGASGPITIVSREDGSGTRGAFVELFGIEEEINGEKVDMTTEEAKITNSTSVMMTTVQGDVNAIGYISLGSLNDTVKAARIDGAEATAENIESGSYKVVRPFNVAAKEDLSEAAADFMAFIMSTEGQAVVEENGYIPVSDVEAYAGNKTGG